MNHTPEPWYIDTTVSLGPYNIISVNETVPQSDCIICTFPTKRRIEKEKRAKLEADAKLIAAVPKLLRACKALLELNCSSSAAILEAHLAITEAGETGYELLQDDDK